MLKVENLNIHLGNFSLRDISFEVKPGEYFMLLGESGAGKSVVLESLAGLVHPDQGSISLNGTDITRLPIQKRKVGLVFQDFALFPHLSVEENILYPLKLRKISRKEQSETLNRLACELSIDHLLKRRTTTLSGGEKQRVALARTLTLEPDVLLLDEPLASVDVSLKGELRSLLRRLNQKGQTLVHVTHDYEEAIALAHRIGIIEQGRIIQCGTPHEVFTQPKNRFVANFGGVKNFYPVTLEKHPDKETTRACITETLSVQLMTHLKARKGFVLIGQKNILLATGPQELDTVNQFRGVIQEVIPARFGYEVVVDAGITFYVSVTSEAVKTRGYTEGQTVWVAFNASSVKFIPG
ncbi:MAG: ABC transporter ATP-binding protein [Salinivirgaceae bacterium]